MKAKNRTQEFQGSIKNLNGKLSNSLTECLENWSCYCEKLYSKTCKKQFKYKPVKNEVLDGPIRYEEFNSVLMSLKNNKGPGRDFITNEDIKDLLSIDDPEIPESTVFLEYVFKVISRFWEVETIPKKLKDL